MASLTTAIYTPPTKGSVVNELLTQETRNAIYEVIKKNPGVHFREVCRSLDRKMGVVQYHARLLEEAGLIQSFGDGRYKRFFIPQTLGDSNNQAFAQKLVAFLQRDTRPENDSNTPRKYPQV